MQDVYDRRRLELRAEPRSWLVTGAAGFIGSHLVEDLLGLGQRVVGLDNFATGSRDNLNRVEQALGSPEAWGRFRFIEADIVDPQACAEAAVGADYVLHQAALGSVPRSIENPRATHLANVDGTLNVFLAAIGAGARRVVYASSSSVYGDDASLPKREPAIGEPLSPYAASKRMGEIYASVLGRTHGLCAVGLRYFNVVGPRQDPDGPYAAVVPRWCAKLASGEPGVIFGDGETTRDFCPVLNIVQGNILAATAGGDLAGRVYNLALQQRISLGELYRALRIGLAERGFPCADLEPEYRDFRPGDIRHSLADIGAASRDLGYTPRVSLRQGLDAVMDAVVLTL